MGTALAQTIAGSTVVATMAVLLGCGVGTSGPELSVVPSVSFPSLSAPEEVMLYNRFTQRLVAFDVASRAISATSDRPNFFQYAFPVDSRIFTAGDSVGTEFSVIRTDDDTPGVTEILRMPDDQGIFPVATDGERYFFIVTEYRNSVETGRRLVRMDEAGRLTTFPEARGLIDSGAIIDGTLYYTVFNEPANDYTLYAIDADDPASVPTQAESHLPRGVVFAYAEVLYLATPSGVSNGEVEFDCPDLCYFYDDASVFIRMYVDLDGSLAIDIVDPESGERLETRNNVIDFRVENGTVTVFGVGTVECIALASGCPA